MKTTNLTVTSQLRLERCSACGALLQDKDPSANGYISPKRLSRGEEGGLCDRCYSLRHYRASDSPSFGLDFIKILDAGKRADALFVLVLDIFFLESSFISDIVPYLSKKVFVVLNKRDILPKSLDDRKLILEAERKLTEAKCSYEEIMVTSSATGLNIAAFLERLKELRKGKDVYFIGSASVGKSSLVNSILRQYHNQTDRVISTKKILGTSLEVMEIPLDQTSSIYDTPGIYTPKSLLNRVERVNWKYLVPREEIVKRTYASPSGQAFIFGGLAVFIFEKGPKTSFDFIVSNEVAITRTKEGALERTFINLAQNGQVHPTSASLTSLEQLERKEIIIPDQGHMVITIFGLGKISFMGAAQKVAILLPKGVGISAIAEEED